MPLSSQLSSTSCHVYHVDHTILLWAVINAGHYWFWPLSCPPLHAMYTMLTTPYYSGLWSMLATIGSDLSAVLHIMPCIPCWPHHTTLGCDQCWPLLVLTSQLSSTSCHVYHVDHTILLWAVINAGHYWFWPLSCPPHHAMYTMLTRPYYSGLWSMLATIGSDLSAVLHFMPCIPCWPGHTTLGCDQCWPLLVLTSQLSSTSCHVYHVDQAILLWAVINAGHYWFWPLSCPPLHAMYTMLTRPYYSGLWSMLATIGSDLSAVLHFMPCIPCWLGHTTLGCDQCWPLLVLTSQLSSTSCHVYHVDQAILLWAVINAGHYWFWPGVRLL